MTRHLDAPDVQIGQALTHFHQLDPSTRDRLFLHLPAPVTDSDTRERLAVALGATLYVPGNRPDLADTIVCRWMRRGSGGGLIRFGRATTVASSTAGLSATSLTANYCGDFCASRQESVRGSC